MPRRNRGPQPNINAAPGQNPGAGQQTEQAGLTRRVVKKLGRGIARSALATGRGIKRDVKEFVTFKVGVADVLVGALLIGVPVGTAYGIVKLPEWVHAGRQWLERNVIKISDEVEDILFLKTFEGYTDGAQWARKFIGAEKARR